MSYVIDYADGRRSFDIRSGIVIDYSGLLVNSSGKGIKRIRAERSKIPKTIDYVPIFSGGIRRIWETNALCIYSATTRQPKLSKREEIYQAAKRLVECGENPQPVASWHESMERLYQSLVRLCKDDWT